MSSRACNLGLTVILGFGCQFVALADDGPPRRQGAVVSSEYTVGDEAARPADRPRDTRVVVRDLRRGTEDLRLQDPFWQYGSSSAARLCLPYGGYYAYGWSGYSASWADDYREYLRIQRKLREREFNRRDMAQREQRLLSQHERALRAGLDLLREGQPERATVAFTLAAKLNHGDPACRIHLAEARLAQGHYLEAGLALRRGLELQPKLVYMDLHVRDHYRDATALDTYVGRLIDWLRVNQARPEIYFLLGFCEFQRGNFEEAYVAFSRVIKAMPKDDLTLEYLQITKPAMGTPR